MKIKVNGKAREVSDSISAQQLIEELDLSDKRIAMEVNREIVLRSTYAEHTLKDGDQIEIVRAIGGG